MTADLDPHPTHEPTGFTKGEGSVSTQATKLEKWGSDNAKQICITKKAGSNMDHKAMRPSVNLHATPGQAHLRLPTFIRAVMCQPKQDCRTSQAQPHWTGFKDSVFRPFGLDSPFFFGPITTGSIYAWRSNYGLAPAEHTIKITKHYKIMLQNHT